MPELTTERLREIAAQQSSHRTELDAMLERVRDLKPNDANRVPVAMDCLRMFEQVAVALKQVRDERDGYAAALQSANQVVTRFGGWLDRWSLPGREKKTSDVYGAWDRVREEAKWGDPVGNPLDPAECLKARDAEVIEGFKSQIMQDVRGILDSAGGKQ